MMMSLLFKMFQTDKDLYFLSLMAFTVAFGILTSVSFRPLLIIDLEARVVPARLIIR